MPSSLNRSRFAGSWAAASKGNTSAAGEANPPTSGKLASMVSIFLLLIIMILVFRLTIRRLLQTRLFADSALFRGAAANPVDFTGRNGAGVIPELPADVSQHTCHLFVV